MAVPAESCESYLDRARGGDDMLAAAIFERFSRRLLALARSRLEARLSSKVDAEDILQSVFRSFFTRERDGRLDVVDADSLWSLLTLITIRKCANAASRYRAARRDVRREVRLENDRDTVRIEPLAREPTAAEAVALAELLERLLRGLTARDRRVLELHLRGFSSAEISCEVGRAERTVRRSIERSRARARSLWDVP